MTDVPPLFDALWFRLAFGFITGGVLGSFATMLAYRLPRHLSIVLPRSQCPSCHTVLGVRDLVPVFSWLFMKGHCRHCHAKIGRQYVLIEVATSLSCALAVVLIGFTPVLLIFYVLIVAIIVALSIKLA